MRRALIGLTPGHKRFWYNRGIQDAKQYRESHLESALVGWGANYYLPQHWADARAFYLLGFRRKMRKYISREHYQRASFVG